MYLVLYPVEAVDGTLDARTLKSAFRVVNSNPRDPGQSRRSPPRIRTQIHCLGTIADAGFLTRRGLIPI